MREHGVWVGFLWLLGVLLVLFPGVLGAVERGKVGVVSLDVEGGKEVEGMVVGWLEGERIQVIDGEVLENRLWARRVIASSAQNAALFGELEGIVAQGTEDFYYKGNEAAIEVLQPVFEMGLLHIDVTGRRAAYVEHVFQAGLMLVRAYSGAGELEQAREIAGKLAVYFPGMEPSLSQVPPDIVALWSEEVAKIAAGGAGVVLEFKESGCVGRIHGVEVGTGVVLVQADMDYGVMLDCGEEEARMWRVRAKGGEVVRVPLVAGDLLAMKAGTLDDLAVRGGVEFWLKVVAYWADIETVFGVGESGAGPVVVRYARGQGGDGAAEWQVGELGQAGGVQAAVDGVMLAFFPAVAVARAERAQAEALRSDVGALDWVTPSLIGSGVVVGIVGGVFLFDAGSKTAIMECSPNAAGVKSAADCSGVQQVRFANAQKFDDAWGVVTRNRVIGYSSLGVGAGLMGWGVYRWLSGGDLGDGESGTDFVVWGGRESLGGTVTWRF